MTAEFTLLATHGSARRGRLQLAHGTVETPAFMPVGTYGTVKAMTPEELEGLGAEMVLGNTFHLMLRPGNEVMRAQDLLARPQHQVEGVAEHDVRAEALEFLGRHRLDGAVGAHRHEGRRLDHAVCELQPAAAWAPGRGVTNMASP